jgi:RNA polymerase sigma factor (TIGR02999 family)
MSKQHCTRDEMHEDRDQRAVDIGARTGSEPRAAAAVDGTEASPASTDPLRDIDPHLYDELRSIATGALRGESRRTAPGTTSLVHEVWLRLARGDRNPANDRQHLLALASLVARRALVDAARTRTTLKRGGRSSAHALPEDFASGGADPAEIIAVDEVLALLAAEHPRQAKALEMRIFGGISPDRIGEALSISATQAKRDVAFARAWIIDKMTNAEPTTDHGGDAP